MDFQLKNKDNRNLDSERIFFENLSSEAQKKALVLKGVADHRNANWDIMPMVYYYEPISNLSQSEIDDEALAFIKNSV